MLQRICAPYRGTCMSAESYATAAVILRLSGDSAAAKMEHKAVALNPHALDEIAWLHAS